MFFFEEKAQAGTVFRLLIDAIIMLAILLIILTALNSFNSFKRDVSMTRFVELAQSIVQTPSGKVLKSDNMYFPKGLSYSSTDLQEITKYPEKCFSFHTNLSSVELTGIIQQNSEDFWGSNVTKIGNTINFKSNVETTVYAKCKATNEACDSGCDAENQTDYCEVTCCKIKCLFSFGRELKDD